MTLLLPPDAEAAPDATAGDDTIPFVHHFVSGARHLPHVDRWGPVYNPSTGKQSGAVPFASGSDVHHVVTDARRAFDEWGRWSAIKRSRVLFRFKALIEGHMDELARLIALEHGKVLADARGEVQRGLEVVEFCCGVPHLMKGEFSDTVSPGIDSYAMRQPLGVAVGITPFNFPVMVPLWMIAPAIACGCTVVLKPSEKDPSAPVRLAELLVEAGAPPGVLNVVHGDREAVEALITHPEVDAVSFVGSTPVARGIYATAAAQGKRVQAMGGAKNHLIVMPDADLDQATDALLGAAYGSAGERCMAISVAVPVGDATAHALVRRVAERVRTLRVGPSLSDGVEMGPLVTQAHHERVAGYVALGVDEGASLVVDGRQAGRPEGAHAAGFFMGGSLFDHVTTDMRIYREEIFGPVLCVVRASSFDEALGMADQHEFGNGVAIYTRDGDAAREFVQRVQVGMVGVNVPIPVPLAFYSFGGWKSSTFGDHNQHGMDGIRFYTRVKTVTSRWPTGIRAGSDFTMPTH